MGDIKYGQIADFIAAAGSPNKAFQKACEKGHATIVYILLQDNRVDPTDYNNYAVRVASANGHIQTVKLLLDDPRVDPADKDNWAICLASQMVVLM